MELFRINEALSHGCKVVSEGYLEGIDCANSVEDFVAKLKNPTRPIMPNNKQYLEKFLSDKNSLLLLKK
jgi:tRNA G18 (ribose-2'-O)-methylase SpoU